MPYGNKPIEVPHKWKGRIIEIVGRPAIGTCDGQVGEFRLWRGKVYLIRTWERDDQSESITEDKC